MIEITSTPKEEAGEDIKKFDNGEWDKQDIIYVGKELVEKYGASNNEQRYFVAMEGDEIVGVLRAHIEYGVGLIYSIIISPNLRGQGIGRQLMEGFEKYAKKKKLKYLYLETRREWKDAVALYRKLGYEIESEIPVYYFGLPWIRMGKALT